MGKTYLTDLSCILLELYFRKKSPRILTDLPFECLDEQYSKSYLSKINSYL